MSCGGTRGQRLTVSNHGGARRGKSLAIAVIVAQSATILLWIEHPIIAQAATIQEVARCRAIQINKERWDCFKSLKAPKQNAPKAKWDDSLQSQKKAVLAAKPEDVPKVTTESVPKVREEDVPKVTTESVPKVQGQDVPKVTTESVPKVQEEDVPKVTTESVPRVQEQDVPKVTTESVPKMQEQDVPKANTENVSKAISEDAQPVPLPRLGTASDDPASTSSIDHLSVAPGQFVCPDQDSLAATFVAGVMLGTNAERIAKYGCKTIPKDARVEILHRFPSGLQFLRVVKVNVTSPSQPDSTVGYTFEISR